MNMFLFSCFLAFCLALRFHALRIKCFIQNRMLFVPVWLLVREVKELGRWQRFQFLGWRSREGEMGWVTEELQRKDKFCSTHHT